MRRKSIWSLPVYGGSSEGFRKAPCFMLISARLLTWTGFHHSIETPGICISAPVSLVSYAAQHSVLVKFVVRSSTETRASIWSPDYTPNSLIPLRQAASSFPDGGRAGFVAWMKVRCSITQDESLQHHLGVDDVWRKLQNAFLLLCPIIYYEPVVRLFLRQLFRTLLDDGVRWVELRTVFITPFLLAGQESPPTGGSTDLSRVFVDEIEDFKKSEEGKSFWGCRFIWTTMRGGKSAQILEGKVPHNSHPIF
jgi:adenosine deaminase CECR1